MGSSTHDISTKEQLIPSFSFDAAVSALKRGERVARKIWGDGNFVFRQVPAEIAPEIVPKMQSLPQSVKDEFVKRGGALHYSNQLAFVHPDNNIHGWTPDISDILAEDWIILN